MTWIYLTDGKGRVRTDDEYVAAHLEKNGFRRCNRQKYAAVGRRLRQVWNSPEKAGKKSASA